VSASPESFADGKLELDRPAEHVARLTISNPAKRNALDHAILDGIAHAVGALGDDVRCLILTGAAGMFSAGYDIGDIPEDVFAVEAEKLVAHPFAIAISALEDFPYPTLAALSGHAIGGGLELAVSCDLRLAAGEISLGMPPAKLGLVYSHTGLRKFVDAIGAPRTRELFFTARNVTAETALAWGLVNRVVADEEVAAAGVELAAGIAANAPLSLAGSKRAIAAIVAAAAPSAEVERELEAQRAAAFASEDFREGVSAFAEKRPPEWRGR
jgi:enoyl-CoA hydratase/carnithine racemase